ncbi:MAG: DUF167 domain-containing protein [Alphaproteobacteria bacterium]|nr:DUF167 domain-containing protein [Alphaproteobacteria bacterium]
MSHSTITVKLTPGARKNEITGWEADGAGGRVLKVKVTAIAEKGKANQALIDLLAKEWKLPKSAITILRGQTGRVKQVQIPKNVDI